LSVRFKEQFHSDKLSDDYYYTLALIEGLLERFLLLDKDNGDEPLQVTSPKFQDFINSEEVKAAKEEWELI